MISELGRELAAVGIRGRLQARILSETEEHVRSDPDAPSRFGDPREIANAFAAELGTQSSRRAALAAFVALGVAGLVYAAAFVSVSLTSNAATNGAAASLALVAVVIAPQLSFVAGALAALRAIRLRRVTVLPSAELITIQRRTLVGLGSGLVTMAGLIAYVLAVRSTLPSWVVASTVSAASVAAFALAVALLPAFSATRFRPRVAGSAGDVFSDLGIAPTSPWRFAGRVAVVVSVVVWLQAALQGDPLDGIMLGVFEALACLAGFAALGRYLRLRR